MNFASTTSRGRRPLPRRRPRLRRVLKTTDLISLEIEADAELHYPARKVPLEARAGDILAVTGALNAEHPSSVLKSEHDIIDPRTDLARTTPGLALVDHDSVRREQPEQSLSVTAVQCREVVANRIGNRIRHSYLDLPSPNPRALPAVHRQ